MVPSLPLMSDMFTGNKEHSWFLRDSSGNVDDIVGSNGLHDGDVTTTTKKSILEYFLNIKSTK
jgi:hypothetical protein